MGCAPSAICGKTKPCCASSSMTSTWGSARPTASASSPPSIRCAASSTTRIAASSGVGKPLMSPYFAAGGIADGERALLYSFSEPSETLFARARRLNLDLVTPAKRGSLVVEYHPPLEWETDEVMDRL